MTEFSVSAGQPIRATHINQFSRWLTGVTKSHTTAITNTHVSEYTLTLTNENATTSNILKLVSQTATILTAGSTVVAMPSGRQFFVGASTAVGIAAGFYTDVDVGAAIVADVGGTFATTNEDHGGLRSVVRQTSAGNSAMRAGEFHAIRATGAGTKSTWGLEVSVNSTVTSAGTSVGLSNIGVYVYSNNQQWITASTPSAVMDDGILVGGANTWRNGFRFVSSGVADLFRVAGGGIAGDTAGDVMAAGRIYSTGQGGDRVGFFNPLTGTSGQTWSGSYYNGTHLAMHINSITIGTGGRPLILSTSGGGVAVGLAPGTATAALAAALHVSGTGYYSGTLLVDDAMISKHVAVPSAQAAGYIGLTAGTDGHYYFRNGTAAAVQVADATTTIVKLGEASGTGTSAVLEVASIPSGYRSLRVEVVGRSSATAVAVTPLLTFESSPTAGAYNYQYVLGLATAVSAVQSIGASNIDAGAMPTASSATNVHGSSIITLPGYAATNTFKCVEIQAVGTTNDTAGTLYNYRTIGMFEATAAIGLVRLTLSGGNWATTSRMTVWGLPA